MSKSKGNAVVPTEILDKFGSDAVRWRAAMARPGMDSPFDETPDEGRTPAGHQGAQREQVRARPLRCGERRSQSRGVTEPLDRSMLAALAAVVREATAAFEAYDYTRALEVTERFFWTFCDDYVELVKERAYGAGARRRPPRPKPALAVALSVQLRLFAPFLPFVTEEVWSWWQEGSVHRSAWPTADEVAELAPGAEPAVLRDTSACSRRCAGRSRRRRCRCAPRWRGDRHRAASGAAPGRRGRRRPEGRRAGRGARLPGRRRAAGGHRTLGPTIRWADGSRSARRTPTPRERHQRGDLRCPSGRRTRCAGRGDPAAGPSSRCPTSASSPAHPPPPRVRAASAAPCRRSSSQQDRRRSGTGRLAVRDAGRLAVRYAGGAPGRDNR